MNFTLLSPNPIGLPAATEAQSELYNYLLDRASVGHSPSEREMMIAMGCKSVLPVRTRLKNLQRKGFIRIAEEEKVA